MRQELVDPGGGVRVDAEQDVAQVLERIDVVEVARRDQRVQASEVAAAVGIADEQERFSSEGDDPQRSFRSVVVQGNADVVEESRERVTAISRVADRLTERALGWERVLVLLEPGEECVDRLATAGPPQLEVSGRAHEPALLGLVLDAVDVEAQVESTARLDGLVR